MAKVKILNVAGARPNLIMKIAPPMEAYRRKPDAVLAVADVNRTVTCGIVAVKMGIPLAHVQAGLRSGERTHQISVSANTDMW